jgi:peptidoglycan/LPS O-acetylase OafA/YrhL
MRKVDSLQVGRAIAVLSIVIYHLTALSIEYQHGYFFAPWMEALRSGVDVFFVISGVVMALTTYRKFDQPGTGSRFLIHRISRIYPPYLLLSAILMIFWLLNPRAINQKKWRPGPAGLLYSLAFHKSLATGSSWLVAFFRDDVLSGLFFLHHLCTQGAAASHTTALVTYCHCWRITHRIQTYQRNLSIIPQSWVLS